LKLENKGHLIPTMSPRNFELAAGALLGVLGLGALTILELVQIWHFIATASAATVGAGLGIYTWRTAIRRNKRRDRRKDDGGA